MARVSRALAAAILAAALLAAAPAASLAQQPVGWYAPAVFEGKAFPVLLSAAGKWLNWRDTFGAPRMRQQPDGTWKQTGCHEGIDIYAERGAPVVSITGGVVTNSGWTLYSGWRVGVTGEDGSYWFYAHLVRPLVQQGQRVRAGDVIGSVGSSGYGPPGTAEEFPPHLHFGLEMPAGSRNWVNAQPMLRSLYEAQVSHVRAALDRAASLRRLSRAVAARGSSPAAPSFEAIKTRLGAIEAERVEIARKLVEGPAAPALAQRRIMEVIDGPRCAPATDAS